MTPDDDFETPETPAAEPAPEPEPPPVVPAGRPVRTAMELLKVAEAYVRTSGDDVLIAELVACLAGRASF